MIALLLHALIEAAMGGVITAVWIAVWRNRGDLLPLSTGQCPACLNAAAARSCPTCNAA